MNDRHHIAWTRLVAAARRASVAGADEEIVVPSGFATRVVAHAGVRPGFAAAGLFGAGFDRLAARALGLACVCAVVFAIWGSLPATAEARSTDAVTAAEAYLDPVGDYLAVVQPS
jgi:hypothetical protein